jgi:hypothetical protein
MSYWKTGAIGKRNSSAGEQIKASAGIVRRTFGVAVLARDCGQLEVQPIAEVLLDGVAIEVLAARPQVSAGRGVAFERRPQRQRAAIPLRARVDAPAHQSCNSAALALASASESSATEANTKRGLRLLPLPGSVRWTTYERWRRLAVDRQSKFLRWGVQQSGSIEIGGLTDLVGRRQGG